MDFPYFARLLGMFELEGEPVSVAECKSGNINKTFVVDTSSGKKYILQRVNESVFRNPDAVMENIVNVTEFLRKKIIERGGDPAREALTLIPAKTGGYSAISDDGGYWRVYAAIPNAVAHDKIERPGQFYNAGYAFGEFQRLLADFDATKLHETIPNFHNTPLRYEAYRAALEADEYGRAAEVKPEIEFIEEHKWLCPIITEGIAIGKFPMRVTHNDTKLNNIMMDADTDEAVCVIDLDTVMPGSLLFDYGDAIRYGASNAAEDEKDLSQVYIRTELFEEFTSGFIRGIGGELTADEAKAMPVSVAVIALELGMRFLTDYLNGDKYFKVLYDSHNLDRTRTQLKLVSDVLKKRAELEAIVEGVLKEIVISR
ncbi:MAG TPA: aminoglycoside phosphotransferase family protein [Clostridiales bacterium]|nr:aminoglycoside phosphotransferase family protein [Clostridiales bacterium]